MSGRRRALDDLEADIRDHIERETQENLERGLPPDEARRQAMLKFGNVALAKEAARAVWIPVWFEQLAQDARYAVRTLRRNPGFATVVVLTLALAIGMNTAVFSVFNGVLLRPVPYPDSNRLVWLSLHGDIPFNAMPITEFAAWREQATSFELMVAYENTQEHTLHTPDGGTQVRTARVSHDFWALTGARPALGRLPLAGEEEVLVLSHAFFDRWFEGDPTVIGRVVTVTGGRQLTIIGVLARDVRLQLPQEALGPALELRSVDVYRPYGGGTAQGQRRGTGVLVPVRVVAKLAPNATIEQARTELETIRSRLAQASPVPFLDEAASAAYARAIGLRLVSGRWFTDAEPAPGVVISESVARRYLGGVDDAIGRRIQICYAAAPGAPCPVLVAPILGVVGDLKYSRLDAGPNPEIYVPYRHYPRGFFQFTAVVRTAADPLASAAEIRKQITDIDRTLPIFDVMTLERALADSIAPRRFNLLLLSAFAAAALLLALIGIYGVTAYVVAQRTPEIAVRMALGARRSQIVRMVAGDGMRLAAAGILIGLAGALALTRFLETLLYDVQPTDPQTFAAVAALLGATVLIACCGSAIKAALVDPIIALRSE